MSRTMPQPIPISHAQNAAPRLRVFTARHADEVEAAQRLRYRVFAEAFGAQVAGRRPGLDEDEYDPFCEHLLVRDEDSGRIVGTYRLLLPEQVRHVGCYYAETEFDLARIRVLPVRILELGRSCVHPDYRNGATIALLWSGLAAIMQHQRIDFVMGCASVPNESGTQVGALYAQLAARHLTPAEQRVFPRRPLPHFDPAASATPATLPPLLKGYLRAGALIGGAPAWDPAFHSADFFMWLPASRIAPRYRRHFCGG